MLKNSACFIIFLIAIFFAVPVVSTLLIYEIEVVRDISSSQGTDYAPTAFLADNGEMLNIAPDPILLAAQMNADMASLGSDTLSRLDKGIDDLYRFSGMFGGTTDRSKAFDDNAVEDDQGQPYLLPVPVATDFSIRLPSLGRQPAIVVKFNRTSELPTSAAMFCIGTGLIGIAGLRRKKYKKRIRRYRRII